MKLYLKAADRSKRLLYTAISQLAKLMLTNKDIKPVLVSKLYFWAIAFVNRMFFDVRHGKNMVEAGEFNFM